MAKRKKMPAAMIEKVAKVKMPAMPKKKGRGMSDMDVLKGKKV